MNKLYKKFPEGFSFYPPNSRAEKKLEKEKGYRCNPKDNLIITAVKGSQAEAEINALFHFFFSMGKTETEK